MCTPVLMPAGVCAHCLTISVCAQVLLQKAQLDKEAAELERPNQLLRRAVEAATAGMQVNHGRAKLSLRVFLSVLAASAIAHADSFPVLVLQLSAAESVA